MNIPQQIEAISIARAANAAHYEYLATVPQDDTPPPSDATHRAYMRDGEAAVQRAPHPCAVTLQPCNAPRIYARSIFTPAEASAYMRACFAALQRQIAGMRGENAEMKQ